MTAAWSDTVPYCAGALPISLCALEREFGKARWRCFKPLVLLHGCMFSFFASFSSSPFRFRPVSFLPAISLLLFFVFSFGFPGNRSRARSRVSLRPRPVPLSPGVGSGGALGARGLRGSGAFEVSV